MVYPAVDFDISDSVMHLIFIFTYSSLLCCRLICLRVHPTFALFHPTESFVSFTAVDASKLEVWPESGEQFYEGNLMPNGNILLFQFLEYMVNLGIFGQKIIFWGWVWPNFLSVHLIALIGILKKGGGRDHLNDKVVV